MGTFTNRDSTIEIAKYIPKTNSFVRNGTIDRTLLGRKDTSLTAEGFTLVNLLGSYGSFDKDSNGDGLADNLIRIGNRGTPSIVDGVTTKAQKLTLNGSNTTDLGADIYIKFDGNPFVVELNHKLFFRSYLKVENNQSASLTAPYGHIRITTTWQSYQNSYGALNTLDNWNLVYCSHTISTVIQRLYITFLTHVNLADGETASIYASDFAVYDLTWMDQYSPMPQSLQEKYSVSKWVDMTDDDLANELPYVDGVAYVGVGL